MLLANTSKITIKSGRVENEYTKPELKYREAEPTQGQIARQAEANIPRLKPYQANASLHSNRHGSTKEDDVDIYMLLTMRPIVLAK